MARLTYGPVPVASMNSRMSSGYEDEQIAHLTPPSRRSRITGTASGFATLRHGVGCASEYARYPSCNTRRRPASPGTSVSQIARSLLPLKSGTASKRNPFPTR